MEGEAQACPKLQSQVREAWVHGDALFVSEGETMTIRQGLESSTLALVASLAPIEGVMATTLGLVVLDLITGILAAKKQGLPITSYGLKRTVVKLLVYEVALALSYVTGVYLVTTMPVLHMVSSLIGLTELKSVLENVDILSGGGLLKSIVSSIQAQSSSSSADDSDVPPKA